MANVFKAHGVEKGDRITLYLPMIPEAAFAMLASARIGAVHSVVFGGFSPDSLANRIQDCDSKLVITADEGVRGGQENSPESQCRQGAGKLPRRRVRVGVTRTGAKVEMKSGRDFAYEDEAKAASDDCPPEPMGAEDPAVHPLQPQARPEKPKGVLHTTAGYLFWAAYTHELVFDYRLPSSNKRGEVFWCTADVGWVTGHSYIVYGPLANGGATLMFEGVPNYPDASRFWR